MPCALLFSYQNVVRKLKQKTPNVLAKSKTALTVGFLSGKYIYAANIGA